MQNDKHEIVDLYIPRKCSATNHLITACLRSRFRANRNRVADVDENGKVNGKKKTLALAGFMRQRGEADACLNRLFADKDLLSFSR